MKLNKRRKFQRRREVQQQPLVQPIRRNQAWSADFMSDALYAGIKYRTFNILDDYKHKAVLDASMFTDLDQIREATEQWLIEYNLEGPHESLGDATPSECAAACEEAGFL